MAKRRVKNSRELTSHFAANSDDLWGVTGKSDDMVGPAMVKFGNLRIASKVLSRQFSGREIRHWQTLEGARSARLAADWFNDVGIAEDGDQVGFQWGETLELAGAINGRVNAKYDADAIKEIQRIINTGNSNDIIELAIKLSEGVAVQPQEQAQAEKKPENKSEGKGTGNPSNESSTKGEDEGGSGKTEAEKQAEERAKNIVSLIDAEQVKEAKNEERAKLSKFVYEPAKKAVYREKIVDWMTKIVRVENPVPVQLHERTTLALPEAEGRGFVLGSTGLATPKVWRLNHGESRVFDKSKRTRGRVIVGIDTSGSMNCWCEDDNKKLGGVVKYSGWLAFQAAAAIAAEHPDTEVFGYSGSRVGAIYQLPPGTQPPCRSSRFSIYGGNADCSALHYMEQQLGQDLGNSIGIIICDGGPTMDVMHRTEGGTFTCDSPSHTAVLAQSMYQRGMRFGVVAVNLNDEDLFPKEIMVRINGLGDMGNLGELFEMLASR